jgi:hypothetical protein
LVLAGQIGLAGQVGLAGQIGPSRTGWSNRTDWLSVPLTTTTSNSGILIAKIESQGLTYSIYLISKFYSLFMTVYYNLKSALVFLPGIIPLSSKHTKVTRVLIGPEPGISPDSTLDIIVRCNNKYDYKCYSGVLLVVKRTQPCRPIASYTRCI